MNQLDQVIATDDFAETADGLVTSRSVTITETEAARVDLLLCRTTNDDLIFRPVLSSMIFRFPPKWYQSLLRFRTLRLLLPCFCFVGAGDETRFRTGHTRPRLHGMRDRVLADGARDSARGFSFSIDCL